MEIREHLWTWRVLGSGNQSVNQHSLQALRRPGQIVVDIVLSERFVQFGRNSEVNRSD